MAGSAQTTSTGVAERLADARRRIVLAAERTGRDPVSARLIAVTKTIAVARVAEAIAAGVGDLGENRVQEAAAKQQELSGAAVRWHLIGHLQTNKANRAAALFDVMHSVDSARVAEALDARRPDGSAPLDVLLEVELTGIAGHTGAPPEEMPALAQAVLESPRLRLLGLMTMAPPVDDPEQARPAFARLRELRDRLQQDLGVALPELSMGMSNDFEVAVEEGATMVRLGRALFGERPPR